jgi:hypothetical protein
VLFPGGGESPTFPQVRLGVRAICLASWLRSCRDDFTHWFDVLDALRFIGSSLKIELYLNV